jgi:hypothetical protein
MVSPTTDILELKLEGNDINPKAVKPGELALLIYEFERSILSAVKAEYPGVDTSEILVSFDSIKDESIGVNLIPNLNLIGEDIKQLIITSYISFTSAVASGNFQNLSTDTIKSLKRIQQVTRKYDCTANFRRNGEYLGGINSDTKIRVTRSNLLSGNTTIYGELFDAGGDSPNIHVRINDQYNIIISASRETVKELANRLYEVVGLKGYAKWDIKTSKIEEFELHNIIDYKPGNVKEAFRKLREISSGYWDKFESNEDINNELLRD